MGGGADKSVLARIGTSWFTGLICTLQGIKHNRGNSHCAVLEMFFCSLFRGFFFSAAPGCGEQGIYLHVAFYHYV